VKRPPNPIRPDGVRYWFDERPPASLSLLLALQQIAFLGSIMTLPVVLGRTAGLDAAGEANLVALTMIVAGLGVMLQALNRFGVGIGLFAPMHTSGVAFPAALAAVKAGGLGLAFGMMSIAGAVQLLVSALAPRLRGFFPVEIAGLTVFMLGSGLGLVGLENLLAGGGGADHQAGGYWVGFFTLAVIVALNVWGSAMWRSFSVFVGLVLGQTLAFVLGLLPVDPFSAVSSVSAFAVPAIGQFGWSLQWSLLPDFIIVGIALSFNCFGVMTIAQRANDAGWRRPDMPGVSRGLVAEGLTNIAGSFINGVTQTASGGALGLAQASGVTSRAVAFVLGALFFLLAFFPPVPMLWSTLSPQVIGAVLIFVGSFITLGGLKILTSRLLDNRKIIMLGIAIIVGLGHDALILRVMPDTPSAVHSIFATSLSISVLVAIALNGLFQLGSRKRLSHDVVLDADWPESLQRLIWHLGHEWSARPEVVGRLDHATNELIETIIGHRLTEADRVKISTRFDEYGCTLKVEYEGEGLTLADRRPDPDDLVERPEAVAELAGYLIRRLADQVKVDQTGGRVAVTLHFDD
jgi:NCS2 family nucleobase:cation symporter-2